MKYLSKIVLLVFVLGTFTGVAEKKKNIKLALLLDTSNSMDGLIEQAKSQLWTIVNELATAKKDGLAPNVQLALYEYGNDNLSASEGHIRQVCAFTEDLDLVSEKLFALTTNGGNEYCGYVIQKSLLQLKWGTDTEDLKFVFIAGNEPFTQGNILYTDACKLAKEKEVIVNTIFCGEFQTGITSGWKNGSDLTGGSYMNINHNEQTVYVKTPYDQKIQELNNKLNKTYVPYGKQGYNMKQNQSVQDNNSQSYGNSNSVNRAISKSSHVYKNSHWDLVDASKDDEKVIESLEEEELPEEMKGMSVEERKKYVEKNRKQRVEVQQEIQKLGVKRKQYISSQNKTEGGALNKAMLETVKKQATAKNYKFK